MKFLIILVIRYMFFTAAIFLTGMVMQYFFSGKKEYMEGGIFEAVKK